METNPSHNLSSVLVSLFLAACVDGGVPKPDTASTCYEEVVECPYRSWTAEDYPGDDAALDPYACFDGYVIAIEEQGCPDNNPTSPDCAGREVPTITRDDQTCAACLTLEGDPYYGHPSYTGECAGEVTCPYTDPPDTDGETQCCTQAEPPWVLLRATICDDSGRLIRGGV